MDRSFAEFSRAQQLSLSSNNVDLRQSAKKIVDQNKGAEIPTDAQIPPKWKAMPIILGVLLSLVGLMLGYKIYSPLFQLLTMLPFSMAIKEMWFPLLISHVVYLLPFLFLSGGITLLMKTKVGYFLSMVASLLFLLLLVEGFVASLVSEHAKMIMEILTDSFLETNSIVDFFAVFLLVLTPILSVALLHLGVPRKILQISPRMTIAASIVAFLLIADLDICIYMSLNSM
jgi:hypothetical protein